jgi:DNA polymerase elongation subunit (family B)
MKINLKDIHNILFLDIETVGIKANYKQLSQNYKSHWDNKTEAINKYYKGSQFCDSDEMYQHKAAIFAEYGKIVCISTAFFNNSNEELELRIKSFYGDNEMEILSELLSLIDTHFNDEKKCYLVGHNIREFDLPYICRRSIINGLALPKLLKIQSKKPWEVRYIIDTLELWRFGEYKNYTSLDLIATCLGIESPKSVMNGSEVHDVYWNQNGLREIVRYCEGDVKTTVDVFTNLIQLNTQSGYRVISKTCIEEEE